jgi:hypothetical protein
MRRRVGAGLFLIAAFIAAPTAAQKPPQGHPLIPPYPGSTMEQAAEVSAFDEFDIPTGPLKDGRPTKSAHVEGKLTMFRYSTPEGRSILEVFRNYESALKEASFATLFTCKGEACGSQVGLKGLGYLPNGDEARYLAARLARPEGDVYVALHVQSLETRFVVVEVKPMDTGLVKISADALNKDIDRVGHVAVYYKVAAARLHPDGVGPLAPVASNDDEAGRTKNRRVELVKQ